MARRGTIRLFWLLLGCLGVGSGQSQTSSTAKVWERIRVVDSATGYAIQPASITQTETAPGRVAITIQAPNYKPVSVEIAVADINPFGIRFLLDPVVAPNEFQPAYLASLRRDDSTLIVGFVVDEAGEPLAGVQVKSAPSNVTAVTDSRGFFLLLVPVQTRVEAMFVPASLLLEKAGYQSHERLRLELTPGGDWEYAITLKRGAGRETIDETTLRHRASEGALAPDTRVPDTNAVNVVRPLDLPTTYGTAPSNSTVRVPRNIRVLQSNGTNVDYVSLDYYTKHVLPAEWIAGWGSPTTYPGGSNSLSAGAVAVRCYAIAKLNAVSSTSAYDICATTSCQVYNPATSSSFTDTAVNYTANWVVIGASGAIASTEYSAEDNSLGFSCGDGFTQPTGGCTYDPVCAGEARSGHGRGMCQWGSAKWASGRKFVGNTTANTTTNGYPRRDWIWIVQHYYPTLTLVKGAPLVVGDDVKALTTLNVRACPDGSISNGVNCGLVTTRTAGATGTIIGGPVQITVDANGTNTPGGGFTWYQVQWSDTTVGWSAENYLERVFSVPTAPASLLAAAAGTNQINLTWTDTSSGVAAGFKVERAIASTGPWLQITNTLAPIVAFSDKSLPTASAWFYRVRAYNAGGSSGYSAVAGALTSNLPPTLPAIVDRTIVEGTLLSITNVAAGVDFAQLLTDFEPFATESSNGIVVFRTPRFSGSTATFVDAVPDVAVITDLVPTNGNRSSRVLRISCDFTNNSNLWLRLTTASTATFPNPVIDFTRQLRFKVYSDKPIRVAIGCRETAVAVGSAIGSDGGTSGGIEWAGVTNISGTAPMPTHLVGASNWTTLTFDLPHEAIRSFSGGNGILSTPSGLGTLEHLAIVPAAGVGLYQVLLDDFAVITPRTFSYSLAAGAPTNATIDAVTGVFNWAPTETQAPGTNNFSVVVTDNSAPPFRITNSFTVVVLETNRPPIITALSDRTIHAGVEVVFTNTAFDPDLPANVLTWSLDPGAPPAATIGPFSGVFDWSTADADANTTNAITVRVTDDGSPPLDDAQTLSITVVPKPGIQSVSAVNGTFSLTWSAISGTSYRVQFKHDLAESGWTDLLPDVPATGPTATFTDDLGQPQRFYRIVVIN